MRRLEFVDSLRGLAALSVVAFHMAALSHLPVPHWAHAVVLNGWSGVPLFFLVSAFSLCHTMKGRYGRVGAIPEFYVRRFFRIAPLFYAMLVFCAIRDTTYSSPHSIRDWAKSILFVFNFFPGYEEGIVSASWTIGVEMPFYAIFPLLFQRFRTVSSLLALFFAALLGSVIFQELVFQQLPIRPTLQTVFYDSSLFRHFPVFIIGMLCWVIFDNFIDGRENSRSIGAALIFGSLFAYYAVWHSALNILFPDTYYWQPIIHSALLLGLAILPARAFVNRLSLFAGKISYSIYLLHPPTIIFLLPVYRRIYYTFGLSVTVSFALCLTLTLCILLPASVLTYKWIEAPGMNLGKRLLAHGQLIRIAAKVAEGRFGLTVADRHPGSTSSPDRRQADARPAIYRK
jgi:peptidoglycan/LPS O-acetylase OafA/YrhL